jgi:hypothetical protein
MKAGFKFTEIDAERHRLGFDVDLPFDIRVRQEMGCALVSAASCRVNYHYHCNFEFPRGILGRAVRLLVRRGLDASLRHSLQHLQRAAEAAAD